MNKGFLNHSATASKDVDNDLIGKGSLLGDLASKIRNIDGKILGRDGKPMVARRCVRFADTTKESVCGDGRSVNNDSSMAEPSSHAVEQPLTSDHQKFMVHGDGIRPELRRTCPMMNDSSSHTNDASIEQNSCCYDYARALVEVSADKPLVDSVDIDIPRDDGKGYTTVNVRIEFEWQPLRCGTCKIFDHLESVCPMKRVAGPSKKSDMQADVKKDKRYIKGYRVNIPKSKLVYRAVVKPQGDNNVSSNMEQSLDITKKPSPSDSSKNDDICFDELRNFIDNLAKEESMLEYVGNKDINGCTLREKQGDKVSTKKSSSSMEILNEDSDTDVDEVFLPNDGIPFPSSPGGGGKPLEEDMLNAYNAYEDQFEEYPSSYQEFYDQFDFKVKGLGRK
ncbi:zinc knuckle CX2CX4HX4C containing protein [Tanacetum coccineum]|uniref:Zinc knuckle CX2CX4HX4C containing protein n=1 Tax=Tanacetum coccineum TaxID=301880 RepID=A0ABQ5FLW3_9ASTR